MVKGTDVTFNDVAFNNNKASGGDHAQAMGGAVYLDSTSNTANHDGKKRVLKASATFNVTKDTLSVTIATRMVATRKQAAASYTWIAAVRPISTSLTVQH